MGQYIVTKDILNIRNKPSDESDDSFIGQYTKGEIIYLNDEEIVGKQPVGGTTNIWLLTIS